MIVKPRPEPRESPRSRSLARALGLVTAVVGVLVLIGWATDGAGLKSVLPGLVTMKANTATGMLLCGVSLALLSRRGVEKPIRYIAAAAALVALALGALTLVEYLVGRDLGIDQWLFIDTKNPIGTSTPGRMSPASSLSFVLVAVALLAAAQNKLDRLRQPLVASLGASVMVLGVLALAGYVLESAFGYHLWNYTGTALHSAAGFVLLGSGLLALVRGHGRLTWSLERANTIAFVVVIVLMVLAGGLSYNYTRNVDEAASWVNHTERVMARLQKVATDIATIESLQQGYSLTGDERLLQLVERARAGVPRDIAIVRKLTVDNPHQQARLDRLEPLLAERAAFADRSPAARSQEGPAVARQMSASGTGTALTERIGKLLEEMQGQEETLLDRRHERAQAASVTTLLLLPLGLFLSLATLSLGLFLLNAGVEERSHAEQATIESRARMAGMIDSAMDAVISLDQQQRIILFNRAAERAFRRSVAETIGRRIEELIPERFRGGHNQHIEDFAKGAVTSRSMRSVGTLYGLRADGEEFPIEAAISQVEVRGEKTFTVIIRDIGERLAGEQALRDSEAQLRLAVEATHLGTWELDSRTGHRRWSDRSKALFGFPAAAEVTGKMISALVHPDDRPRLDAVMRHALEPASSGELDMEFRIQSQEEPEERWIQSRGRVLREDGRAVRVIGTMLDITVRKRAEAALRASEGRYRTLFECAPDGILIADRESYYLSANASICRMLGYSPDELVGMHASDIVVQSEIEHITPALSTITSGSDYHREWQFRRKDGSVFAAEVIATMMPDGYLMGMVRDITERKEAEAALRDSEERFRTMANSILQLAWIARADGYIVWYNQRWFEYTGTTPEQVEGWGWQSVHDPAVLPGVMEAWRGAIGGGNTFLMEFPLRGANGQFRTFLTSVQPLKDAAGRVVQWFGTHTDVEELKQVEERVTQLNAELEQRVADRTAQLEAAVTELSHGRAELKSLFESLPGLYLVLTPELEIVAVSDAYLTATMTTREGILGRHLFEIFPDNPDDPETRALASMEASIDRVMRDGIPDTMAIQKHDIRRPDGVFEERYWSPINSPMFGADRQIKYLVHRVEEVTEFVRQRAQLSVDAPGPSARMQQMEAEIFQSSQKLQAANLQLEAANRELEAFSYSVSHDLRAPLRGVSGYVRMLQEDCAELLGPEGHRLLDVVSSEAKRMGQLIDDLLAFSRLGRVRMERRAVDMSELARAVFAGLISSGPELAPRFELKPLPAAQGDLAMLRQVFVNLIGNAIKFSRHQQAPVIEVGCTDRPRSPRAADSKMPSGPVGAAGSENTYYVKDNGAGFDEKYSHKLFGVFQRLHSEDEFEGTGVGLALVQRVIQRHSGSVWAEGRPGEGATFYFTLPVREERTT
jgi:PAS domain S-box-containing protein